MTTSPALFLEAFRGRRGVVVTQVVPWGPAAQAGVRHGMFLLRLNRQPVPTPTELDRVAKAIGAGAVVALLVVDPEVGETVIDYRTRR